MNSRMLRPIVSLLAFQTAFCAETVPFTQDFDTSVAPTLPAGWVSDKKGKLPLTQAVLTSDPALVIKGNQSLLFVVSGEPYFYDNDIGGFYSANDVSPSLNLAPGTYRISARFRVVDPGIKANLSFYYSSHDAAWTKKTNDISIPSQSATDTDGLISWLSDAFTVHADNPNFFIGLQVQVLVDDVPAESARIVLDDVTILPAPAR